MCKKKIDCNDPKQNPQHIDNFNLKDMVPVPREDLWTDKDPYTAIRRSTGEICPFIPIWFTNPWPKN